MLGITGPDLVEYLSVQTHLVVLHTRHCFAINFG